MVLVNTTLMCSHPLLDVTNVCIRAVGFHEPVARGHQVQNDGSNVEMLGLERKKKPEKGEAEGACSSAIYLQKQLPCASQVGRLDCELAKQRKQKH